MSKHVSKKKKQTLCLGRLMWQAVTSSIRTVPDGVKGTWALKGMESWNVLWSINSDEAFDHPTVPTCSDSSF